jgi:hypothetical protein
MEEVYQRWVALSDRAWQRRYGKLTLALALVCGLGATFGGLLSQLAFHAYYSALGMQGPGLAPPQTPTIQPLATAMLFFAAWAWPAGLVLGVLRAWVCVLPVEFACALGAPMAFKLQLRVIRRALYETVLAIITVPVIVHCFSRGWSQIVIQPTLLHSPASHNSTPSYIVALSCWIVICEVGFVLCLLEWQVILLSRFLPQPRLAWLQALPYGLPWLGYIVSYLADSTFTLNHGLRVAWQPPPALVTYDGSAVLLAVVLGLVAAPLLWRWMAGARSPWRWMVISLCCMASFSAWNQYYYAWPMPARRTAGMAAAFGRGVYLGDLRSPLSDAGLLDRNPLGYDLLAVCLAPSDEDEQAISDPGGTDSLTVFDASRDLSKYKTPGPGVALTFNIFLPWYLALIALVLYYVYSYRVLRRAAQIIPAEERYSPDRR